MEDRERAVGDASAGMSRRRSVALAVSLVVAARLVLGAWAVIVPQFRPPAEPAATVGSPYLGAPRLDDGIAGALLGPWQRFDTQRYVRIAREGYVAPDDSHYPPLYPLLIRAGAAPFGSGPASRMFAALAVATLAAFGAIYLLHRLALRELDDAPARNVVLLYATFPMSFFLFAGYSESLFIFLCLASFLSARDGRFGAAGGLGALASLTRLTGWVLALPIAWEAFVRWRRRSGVSGAPAHRELSLRLAAACLPVIATAGFLVFRRLMGFEPLDVTFAKYWARTPGIPGQDLLTAMNTLFLGGEARAGQVPLLWVDFVAVTGMLASIPFVFRRLGASFGLYSVGILFFLLLATSDVLPLYSVARYVLPIFPPFLLLGLAVQPRRLLARGLPLVSLSLWLLFSGLFFSRNWVG